MEHKLSKQHLETCQQIKKYKADNKENKNEFYLLLEEPTLKLILKSDITPTSKILLVFLLSKLHFSYKHLYIHLPYKLLEQETHIKKATAINTLKDLDEKGFIIFHSGTNRIKNKNMKEFIFEQEQNYYNPMRNQSNIIEMTPFFHKLFKVEK